MICDYYINKRQWAFYAQTSAPNGLSLKVACLPLKNKAGSQNEAFESQP